MRALIYISCAGTVPIAWQGSYKTTKSMTWKNWWPDFLARLQHMNAIAKDWPVAVSQGIWLGGLFMPEAYITATRQLTAHQLHVSMESLNQLTVDTENSAQNFCINGTLH